jgi:hypothetical protein
MRAVAVGGFGRSVIGYASEYLPRSSARIVGEQLEVADS